MRQEQELGLKDLIDILFNEVEKLKRIKEEDIPEAFPIIETSGSPDGEWGQIHSQDEFFGARQKTELEDAHRAQGVLTELLTSVSFVNLLVSSLYPTDVKGTKYQVEVRDTFENIKNWLEDAKATLENCQKIILESTDGGLKPVINRKNLRKLKNHLIKMGYTYATTRKIPEELLVKVIADQNAKSIEADFEHHLNLIKNGTLQNNQTRQQTNYENEALKYKVSTRNTI